MVESFKKALEKNILDRHFLKQHQITRQQVKVWLASDAFNTHLSLMMANKSFHCKDALELIKPFLNRFTYDLEDQEWLNYFYQYALHHSFPEAVSIELLKERKMPSELYMKVLSVMCDAQKKTHDATWQSQYPITFLTTEDVQALEDATEYLTFERHFREEYVYEMMKLNQDVIGYTTLDHVCGVYFLALRIARQLKALGYHIDLGRVAGAAAGHDIGKFGCKQNEMHRVAYYHYFYTGEWFEKRDIVYIRNVAINHSTWDLELEALPIESLILIYSDFRVKAEKVGNQSHMRYYTLQDSFDVILNKLDNLDQAKELRYRKVYDKLHDFERFMVDQGVETNPDQPVNRQLISKRKYFSLMQGNELNDNVIFSSIRRNIELLYRLRDEASLNKLLEPVRNTRDLTELRGYLAIIEEYYNHLTQKQKQIIVSFLYEKLVLPEEDIRKQCAELMGTIIATYDEEIRKETPPSARVNDLDVNAFTLFEHYLLKLLRPDNKIIDRHKKYISYSIRDMLQHYFRHTVDGGQREKSITLILTYFVEFRNDESIRFYLIKAARVLPFNEFNDQQTAVVLNFVSELLTHPDIKLRLRAYNLIYAILPFANEALIEKARIKRVLEVPIIPTEDPAHNYAKLKLAEQLQCDAKTLEVLKSICLDDLKLQSTIYLSNLKSATLDVAKKFQIELLMRNTLMYDYENTFYMAMHLCNLLKVSARESVRNMAGRMLVQMITHLSFEQKNDIAVELIRSLEMESYEFTKYIPPYLGSVLLQLKPKELDEILESFEEKMSTNNETLIVSIQKTLGFTISGYSNYRHAFIEGANVHENRVLRMFGILFNGFVHRSSYVNQMAFNVISRDIFTNEELSLKKRAYLYQLTIKKMMSLMANTDEGKHLIFYNNAASLKHMYHFISNYRHQFGDLKLKAKQKIAFFPGTFDPFTLSHKQIAIDIKEKGFEVLLYVDEFSWSKRTQPNLIRRNIIKKSIANEIDIFQFPRDISINIANNHDIERLLSLFPESEIFIVAGSDVLLNASAYKKPLSQMIKSIPHVVYERGGAWIDAEEARLQDIMNELHHRSIRLALPRGFEKISSTLIRDYIDENRDISSMIAPLAQNYIYDKNIYQREPLFKDAMTTKSLTLELIETLDADFMKEALPLIGYDLSDRIPTLRALSDEESFKIMALRSHEEGHRLVAVTIFHWLRASNIHHSFEAPQIIHHVRHNSVGRILVLDGIFKRAGTDVKNVEQIMLTETLAYALSRDYTYCVYRETFRNQVPIDIADVLALQGFIDVSSSQTGEHVFTVNMTSPCTLNLDIHSMFKEPYRSMPEVNTVLLATRKRLQKAIAALYPGHLVLNFDRSMIYETLIKKVCDENKVSTQAQVPRELGEAMCVPFGAVFKKWILPNTVTKTLHAEKYFSPDLVSHHIKEYPFYLDIENQLKMLKSYDRPVILVDDLLNKGYRIRALEPYFKEQNLNVQKLIVGIMSGQGKEVAEAMHLNVDAAYFIPKIKVWFYESKLYPFVDGDAIWRGSVPESNLIPSVNLILPYASAAYIVDASKTSIYHLSEVALTNAADIMSTIETVYENMHERLLTIKRLSEVMITPRFPDKGEHILYANNVRPSEYIQEDLLQLKKLKNYYID